MSGPVQPVAVGAVVGDQQLAAIDATALLPVPLKARVGAVAWADDGTIELQLAPAGTVRLGPPSDLPRSTSRRSRCSTSWVPTHRGRARRACAEAPVLSPA